MKRYFYICDDLDELEAVEKELETAGICTSQIHVLSANDSGLKKHHLNQVSSFLKTDIIHCGLKGALVGLITSIVLVLLGYQFGITAILGWTLSIIIAILVMGFCTWEAGFIGIQLPNSRFKRFESALKDDRHILLVDVDKKQQPILKSIIDKHSVLEWAGSGLSMPKVIIAADRLRRQLHHIET